MTDNSWRNRGWVLACGATLLTAPFASIADEEDEEEALFAVADVFIELNDTDGDLGLQAFIDGEPWKRVAIEGPNGRDLFKVYVKGRLRRQGLNEIFFESAEPGFDELPPEKFLRRFPEGIYEVEGRALNGEELENEVPLTHRLPAPAEGLTLSGQPAPEDCDAEPLPAVSEPLSLAWNPVTMSHPEIGRTGEPVDILLYQVTVEREEGDPIVLQTELPPSTTQMNVPSGLFASGDVIKIGILAKEASGNQTTTESCFEIE